MQMINKKTKQNIFINRKKSKKENERGEREREKTRCVLGKYDTG